MAGGYRAFAPGELGEPWLSRIHDAAKARGAGSAVSQGNLGGEVGLLLVGTLLFGSGAFFFATSHTITRMEPLLVVIGLALLAWSIYRLRRRFGSKLGTFSLSTGAYYVESDGGRLNVWDRSRASGIRFHHNYHRGIYTGTVMIFEYPGASLAIGDVVAPIDADEELLARSRIFQQHLAIWRTARDARAAGAFDRIDGFALVPPGALD